MLEAGTAMDTVPIVTQLLNMFVHCDERKYE
jgi:hypothetical protein